MEIVFDVKDEKCCMMKEDSCNSLTKSAAFPGASGEDSEVITVAGGTNLIVVVVYRRMSSRAIEG